MLFTKKHNKTGSIDNKKIDGLLENVISALVREGEAGAMKCALDDIFRALVHNSSFPKERKDAILKELERTGWLQRTYVRPGGKVACGHLTDEEVLALIKQEKEDTAREDQPTS